MGAHRGIPTGVYPWPLEDSAGIAVETVRNTSTCVAEVRLVPFDDWAYEVFAARTG